MINRPVIKTDRLVLRVPEIGDSDAFAAFLKLDRSKFVGGPGFDFMASCRAWGHAAASWMFHGYGPFTICLPDGTTIGHAGPWFPRPWPEPEFGWCLWAEEYDGQGYASEAMTAIRDWTFANTDLTSLVAYIDPANDASKRLAERLGGVVDPNAKAPDDDPVVIYRISAGAHHE